MVTWFFSVPQRPGYALKSKERRRYPYLEVYLSFSECLDRDSYLQWMLPCCCVCIFVYCILVYLFLQPGLCLNCTSSKCRTFTTVFSVSCALVHTPLVIDPFISKTLAAVYGCHKLWQLFSFSETKTCFHFHFSTSPTEYLIFVQEYYIFV